MQRHRPEYPRIDTRHPLGDAICALLGGGHSTSSCLNSSSLSSHGALTAPGTTSWVYDKTLQRRVLDFNGSSQNVIVPVSLPFSDLFTVSFWFKNRTATYGSNAYVIGQYDTGNSARMWALFITPSGQLLCPATGAADGASGDTGVNFGYNVTEDAWTHISVLWRCSARSYDLYVNGVYNATVAPTAGYTTTAQPEVARLTVGGLVASNWVNCQVADVLIHPRLLSPQQIQQAADQSNVMLSGLIPPPRRKLFMPAATGNRRRRALIAAS